MHKQKTNRFGRTSFGAFGNVYKAAHQVFTKRPYFAFIKNDNELVIKPHKAEIVHSIYQMYLDGARIIGIQHTPRDKR